MGGLKGSKIKLPVYSEVLSALNPVSIAGGSKSLFIVTNDGKVSMLEEHYFLKTHNKVFFDDFCIKNFANW